MGSRRKQRLCAMTPRQAQGGRWPHLALLCPYHVQWVQSCVWEALRFLQIQPFLPLALAETQCSPNAAFLSGADA